MRRDCVRCSSSVDRFMDVIDICMQRVNIGYLLKGYFPFYSLGVAFSACIISLSLLILPAQPLYAGAVPLVLHAFSILILTGGLFNAAGGKIKQRKHQGELITESVKDVLSELLRCATSSSAVYVLLALEVFVQMSAIFSEAGCICCLCWVWFGWLLCGKREVLLTCWREGGHLTSDS
ncbi:uncharacterized protein TEOVI_000064600 [Trypanosoma equiperdum]|uniref:Uncharacterized protein n=2 Tax=Trypanozoon TaxID=39700 RepID=Q584P4_TRYB2|nr:hypothetical protein, conserved [Trypanosoma brucei brucei TREU927]AAX80894.1 hypothetical protein, conserved [Trypanosoma brucei]AAZ11824.1 hypothetical protein, conserved [Trypanosoma brucei brucei TREU927]SCU69089.1 hypothetical protein, conserved [Trypanosoma equiperdum]